MDGRSAISDKGYRAQIDSLRAIAATAVIYNHFWNIDSELGYLAIRLFFVISGFLLTGILLRELEGVSAARATRGTIIKRFFLRRILRIWPAYYGALIFAVIMNARGLAETFGWHALFASNILFFVQRDWYPSIANHLWTLAVEERFYLFLPFVVAFTRAPILKRILIIAAITAVAFRALGFATGDRDGYFELLAIGQLDALGGGALLALVQHQRGTIDWKRLLAWSFPVALLVALFAPQIFIDTIGDGFWIVPMAAAVSAANAGIGGPSGVILESRGLVYLGRISYGLYLYHPFVAGVVVLATRMMGMPDPRPSAGFFAVVFPLTVLTATLSWFAIERPVLSLKRRLYPRIREVGLIGAASVSAAP